MSRRGVTSRNNYQNAGKNSAYPYRGSNFTQHDDRRGGRDGDSGEHYNSRSYQGGDYRQREGGRGRFRGGYSKWRGGRSRGRRPYRSGPRGGHHYGTSDSHLKDSVDADGDIEMDGKTSRPRPYERPTPRYGSRQNNSWKDQRPQGPRWSLLTVIHGASLDSDWLIDAIKREAMIQFTPVQYHIHGNDASFCIEDETEANGILNCHKKISTPDGAKLVILKSTCSAPVTEDQLVVIKQVLSERYNTETLHLDASSLYYALKGKQIDFRVGSPRDMNIVINIISEHIAGLTSLDLSENRIGSLITLKSLVLRTPRLKCLKLAKNRLNHIKELEFIKEWDLAELNLDGNALCAYYKEQSEYISAVRDRFPNLLVLDGIKLPAPVKFDLEKVTKLPTSVLNHIPENVTTIIKEFVKQYFTIYDSDRDGLMQAYHPNCMFSLCIPATQRGYPLTVYFSHSRNLQRMKSQKNKFSYLKSSQLSVCALLKELPKTEHDLAGFFVDVPLASPTLLKFIIRGIFRETTNEKGKNVRLRAFSRAFLCLTDGARLSIINEELYIRNPTKSEAISAFLKPPITPSPSPVPELITSSVVAPAASVTSPSKSDLVIAFCKESGMNSSFSEQCLAENGWDYAKAGQAFMRLKEEGKIPPQAFIQ